MDWLLPVLSATFAAGGAWAAVRTELHYLKERISEADANAARAHSRIDQIQFGKVRP